MKIFNIPDAATLKKAAEHMVDQAGFCHARNFATVWSTFERKGSPIKFQVRIELGRSAMLVKTSQNNGRRELGKMMLGEARKFVKEENLVEDT